MDDRGDFNMITSEEEKYGGLPGSIQETQDFKCLGNLLIQNVYPNIEIEHLIRTSSDHAPMLISYSGNVEPIKKPFKFLNFWVKHDSFLDTVKQHWKADFMANPFILFHHKMKKVKAALMAWSKNTYGNIFQEIESLEDVIKVHEEQYEINPSPQNREKLHKVQAKLNRYLYLEEAFWKQKVGMQWFDDGDKNTKFFHTYVQSRRKRLHFKRMQDQNGVWLEEKDGIAAEAIRFQGSIIFKLKGESAGGPDDFTGLFCQHCWSIIEEDVTNMVKSFFCGAELPRFITHTNLVMLPKKDLIYTFSDMRPISLSNFINKVFSRLIHERMADGLQKLISANQESFVK
ncbi:uncharacterized protein LOC132045804 [Lycium ferocissimum]|uniref:uncharacterized protein LOC132045804 n=1 Tax=Lycium ferocissimum TaxID=112874 RepID=UPI0028161467|nr:uncharacterized protein LOC132045804 [Lycium ferocissimum]